MTINLRNKTESIHLHDNNLHKNDLSIINKKKYVSRFDVLDFYCNPFPATHDFAKEKCKHDKKRYCKHDKNIRPLAHKINKGFNKESFFEYS